MVLAEFQPGPGPAPGLDFILLSIGGKDDRGQSPSCRVCKNSSSMNWDPQNEEIPDLPTFTSFILGIYSI